MNLQQDAEADALPVSARAEIVCLGEVRARGHVVFNENLTCDFVAEGEYTLSDRTADGCILALHEAPTAYVVRRIKHVPGSHFALVLGAPILDGQRRGAGMP